MPFVTTGSKSWAMLDNSSRLVALALVSALGATSSACDPAPPPEIPDVEPAPRVPEPVPTVEGDASRSLLQGYVHRDPDVAGTEPAPDPDDPRRRIQRPVTWEEESQSWMLPYRSKRLMAALMIAAAHDRLESLRFILTPDAQWGWPDPRRPGARPVFDGDGGEAFFQALRTAASRLPERAKWRSLPVPTGIMMLHTTGAEPMWTLFAEGLDVILMQMVVYEGRARIAYVGLFETLPEAPPDVTAYGPMPPLVPPLRRPPGSGSSGSVPGSLGSGASASASATRPEGSASAVGSAPVGAPSGSASVVPSR